MAFKCVAFAFCFSYAGFPSGVTGPNPITQGPYVLTQDPYVAAGVPFTGQHLSSY